MNTEANGGLVECPICYGCGMLTNSARDPQDHEDGDCHGCDGEGKVSVEHREKLIDEAREWTHVSFERDREWWS